MSDLNIKGLFPNSKTGKKNNMIDIKSLYIDGKYKQKIPKVINIDNVIEEEHKKKKIIAIAYRKMLNEAIETFKECKKYGYIDCMYEIRKFYKQTYIPDVPACRNYILHKLRNYGFDTCAINDNIIFITWENLEENIKNINKNKENKENKKHKKHKEHKEH